MDDGTFRFLSMMGASLVVLAAVLWLVLRRRARISLVRILLLVGIITIAGMVWGRYGAQAGWPWGVYLLPPMAATLAVPPLAFRMTRSETIAWVALATLAGPLVHVAFSAFLGWGEYIPAWRVPRLWGAPR